MLKMPPKIKKRLPFGPFPWCIHDIGNEEHFRDIGDHISARVDNKANQARSSTQMNMWQLLWYLTIQILVLASKEIQQCIRSVFLSGTLEKVELHKKHLGPSFINCRSVTCLARQLKIVTQSSDHTLWIKNHIDLNYKTFVVISQDPIYISETAKKVDFYISKPEWILFMPFCPQWLKHFCEVISERRGAGAKNRQ